MRRRSGWRGSLPRMKYGALRMRSSRYSRASAWAGVAMRAVVGQ